MDVFECQQQTAHTELMPVANLACSDISAQRAVDLPLQCQTVSAAEQASPDPFVPHALVSWVTDGKMERHVLQCQEASHTSTY